MRRTPAYFAKRLRDLAPIMGWKVPDKPLTGEEAIGTVLVDYYPAAGGYSLVYISTPGGGEKQIGFYGRRSAAEFDLWLDAVAWASGWQTTRYAQQFPALNSTRALADILTGGDEARGYAQRVQEAQS